MCNPMKKSWYEVYVYMYKYVLLNGLTFMTSISCVMAELEFEDFFKKNLFFELTRNTGQKFYLF